MIRAEMVGDGEVIARLDALPDRIRTELKVGIGRATIQLQRRVMDKLDGDVLKVRTGRLRRSIGQVVEDSGDQVAGVVSTPVVYAPMQEYGFSGAESVRASLRTIRQAFGRPITERQVDVRAHTRQVKYPAHSFLRTALAELEAAGVIGDEIDAALKRAAA